jgi:putative PIN family toxin of toxin-antitoxin system
LRIVLDTNVLVAAFIAHGACSELFEHVLSHHELLLGRRILEELENVLTGKLRFPGAKVRALLVFLDRYDQHLDPPTLDAPVCRDADDDAILAFARAARADCIVSGDGDLLSLGTFEGIRILTPRSFWSFDPPRA